MSGYPDGWFRDGKGSPSDRDRDHDPDATAAMPVPDFDAHERASRPARPPVPDPDATQVIPQPPLPPAGAALPPHLAVRRPEPQRTVALPVHSAAPAPAAPDRGAPPAPPSARPRRRRFRIGRLLAALPFLLLLYIGLLLALVATSLEKVDAFKGLSDRPAATAGETWLLVGSDSREGLSAAERKRLSTGSSAGQRTDTVMLMHVPSSGKPTLVSLPRDSYVAVPGNGRTKLNAAYAIGGAPLLVRTVERATDLRIDHYMEVGFAGVVGVTDAVGGVDVCIDRNIDDAKSGLRVTKGCKEIDGATSLAYVRARYFDAKGDLGRIERQQQWLASLADRITSPRVLLNPVAHVRLARSGTDAVTVDEDSGILDLLRVSRAMRSVSGGGGTVTTVPVSDPDYRVGGQSFVRWDEDKADALFAKLRRG